MRTSLLDAPDEVLEAILCLLPPNTVRNCVYVCRRMSRVAKVKPLHQAIILYRPSAVMQFREHLLRKGHAQLVKSITFLCASADPKDLLSLAMQAPLLEILPNLRSFSSTPLIPIPGYQTLVLNKIIRYNRLVRHVELQEAGNGLVWEYDMALSLVRQFSLQSLHLAGKSSQPFGQPRNSFLFLQELAIRDRTFGRNQITPLVDSLPNSLSSLSFIYCNGLPSNFFALIADRFRDLTILCLLHNNTDDLESYSITGVEGKAANLHKLRNLALGLDAVTLVELVRINAPLARVLLDRLYSLDASDFASLLAKWQCSKGEFNITVRPAGNWSKEEKVMLQHIARTRYTDIDFWGESAFVSSEALLTGEPHWSLFKVEDPTWE